MTLAIPESLQARLSTLYASLPAELLELCQADAKIAASLDRVLVSSDFIAQACLRHPQQIQELIESGDLLKSYRDDHYKNTLAALLTDEHNNEVLLQQQLRIYRRREMVRIAWRDIADWAHLNETLEDLSHLADACVDEALKRLYRWQSQDMGTPCNEAGEAQQLVVLGMGKLGAYELNYSSDIDLIFAFPEQGETRDGPRVISNEQFFIRLGQRLIQAVDNKTVDGFVFRVDMRLRPFGDSGPLALSFAGMESYYTSHGREWERYAMIKARVIAGDLVAGKELMAMLRPFVYRRYLDFGAYENLREMKAMIAREVTRKGMEENVKLGPGGIREVEFIGQAFQLIRGGNDRALQERRILRVLGVLQERDILPEYVVDELIHAYIFLRDSEHRLQQWRDEQTQMLPKDEEGKARLAYAMGFDSWQAYRAELAEVMATVHSHFEQIFEAPQAEENSEAGQESDLKGLWQGLLEQEQAEAILQQLGYTDCGAIYQRLQGLRHGSLVKTLSQNGQKRLNTIMPMLIAAVGMSEDADTTFQRVMGLLERIVRRSAYLALLIENPMALSQLVKLCAASPWIANQLSQYPILLDELLDPRSLYRPPEKIELEEDLRRRLAKVDVEDLETQMEVLRHFHHASVLRVAAADVMEAIPLMVVSDHLTWIAEVILNKVLDIAWWHMVRRHGRPRCTKDGQVCDLGFAIIAYGKLGGYELGYGSDLDIVFLHDSESDTLPTDGERPIESAVFFARLGQRIIHILGTQTPSGTLYEVDTRLRPSGASGLLVTSLEAYEKYEREKAWTWEHQALVRARFVAGDVAIAGQFESIRHGILAMPRDKDELKKDVREMRQKMRDALGSGSAEEFDIKQDVGGIADIEFMVQYGVLAWANEYPDLLRFSDNIRILERLAANGLMTEAEAGMLIDAYRVYRRRVHHLKLKDESARVSNSEFTKERAAVSAFWQQWIGNE